MSNDFYGFYKDENGYIVTKNGDDCDGDGEE